MLPRAAWSPSFGVSTGGRGGSGSAGADTACRGSGGGGSIGGSCTGAGRALGGGGWNTLPAAWCCGRSPLQKMISEEIATAPEKINPSAWCRDRVASVPGAADSFPRIRPSSSVSFNGCSSASVISSLTSRPRSPAESLEIRDDANETILSSKRNKVLSPTTRPMVNPGLLQ